MSTFAGTTTIEGGQTKPEQEDVGAGDEGRIRVVVVDDHRLVRDGLRSMLEATDDFQVIGEAADGLAAVTACKALNPDIVLMDLSMPGMDGIEATRQITARRPTMRVLVLTTFTEDHLVRRALDAGAAGYMVKDADPEAFRANVRAVARGEAVVDSRAATAVTSPAAPVPHLTPRNRQVLDLLVRGMTNKQIANALQITEPTAKAHLQNLFRRLGVRERTSAALWGERNGAGLPRSPEPRSRPPTTSR